MWSLCLWCCAKVSEQKWIRRGIRFYKSSTPITDPIMPLAPMMSAYWSSTQRVFNRSAVCLTACPIYASDASRSRLLIAGNCDHRNGPLLFTRCDDDSDDWLEKFEFKPNIGRSGLPGSLSANDRAFPVAADRLWNGLPSYVTAAPSLSIFCCCLKSHLFSLSYSAFRLFSHFYSERAVTRHFGHSNRN